MTKSSGTKTSELTMRERQILHCVKQGLDNPEISSMFNISIKTIKYHLTSIYKKAGVKSIRQLLAKYIKELTNLLETVGLPAGKSNTKLDDLIAVNNEYTKGLKGSGQSQMTTFGNNKQQK